MASDGGQGDCPELSWLAAAGSLLIPNLRVGNSPLRRFYVDRLHRIHESWSYLALCNILP